MIFLLKLVVIFIKYLSKRLFGIFILNKMYLKFIFSLMINYFIWIKIIVLLVYFFDLYGSLV